MKKTGKNARAIVLTLAALAMTPFGNARADVPGNGPLKIIVPFSAGAMIDNSARKYAEKLSPKLGRPIVVENRPGAGGMVGTQRLLAEDPKQNTMLFVSSSYAVNPSVFKDMPFDTLKDLSGVALLADTPILMVVNPDAKFKSIQDFVDKAKKRSAPFSYGSAGINSATDMAGRYFSSESGAPLEHIPYKAVHEGMMEVVAGRVDTSFPGIAQALPYVRDGKLQALAITGKERSPLAPDVPTLDESVSPGFDYGIWYGVIMSAKTDPSVKQTLATHLAEINKDPEIRQWLEGQGLTSRSKTLLEFDAYIASEISKYGKILNTSN
jgi:tripartite-type tricarboxylate transporter receptor subunit TctC